MVGWGNKKNDTPDGRPMEDEPDQKERDAEQARIFREDAAARRGGQSDDNGKKR